MLHQDSVMKCLYQYVTGTPSKVLCLTGPTGSGKSFAVERLSKLLSRRLTYIDEETSFESASLSEANLYVFDEPEESLSKMLPKLLKVKAILLTTDLYGPVSSTKAKLQLVRMNPYTDAQKIEIFRSTIDVSDAVLKIVAETCGQDIRYGLRLLEYAIQTAKAKRPGHKTIVGPKDLSFDLFTDTANAFAHKPTAGLQGDDLFLYALMLQTNCVLRTKKVTKVLDAFSLFDVIETSKAFPTEMLTTLLETSLLEPIAKDHLEMFKVPNAGKRISLLQEASGQRDYPDTLWAIRALKDCPTKGLAPEIREVRKTPYVAK